MQEMSDEMEYRESVYSSLEGLKEEIAELGVDVTGIESTLELLRANIEQLAVNEQADKIDRAREWHKDALMDNWFGDSFEALDKMMEGIKHE